MMDRLTDEGLREMIEDLERDCNPANDDIFDALVELHAYRAAAPLEKAQEWAKAFEEGRLVVLPPHMEESYNGLKVKYRVYKTRNGEPVENCFVLRPEKDMAARAAIRAYASDTGNRELACDLDTWMNNILDRKATREEVQAALDEQEGADPHA